MCLSVGWTQWWILQKRLNQLKGCLGCGVMKSVTGPGNHVLDGDPVPPSWKRRLVKDAKACLRLAISIIHTMAVEMWPPATITAASCCCRYLSRVRLSIAELIGQVALFCFLRPRTMQYSWPYSVLPTVAVPKFKPHTQTQSFCQEAHFHCLVS